MRSFHPRGARVRPLVLLALSGLLALALTAPSSAGASPVATAADPGAAASRARPTVDLDSVGSRYVGTAIPIQGFVSGVRAGRHKLVLQRFSPARHRWVARATQRVRNGAFVFPAQYRTSPGWVTFRTVLHLGTKRVGSNRLRVQVLAAPAAQPAPAPAPAPAPPPPPPPAPTCANSPTVANCLKPVGQQPDGAVLPDLRIKDLTKCGAGDFAATGGKCFMVDTSVPGKKLLKFGVITFNVGAGPAEVFADRSSSVATEWAAYQNFYDANGNLLGSLPDSGVQFYFAGDGHNHWHVRDFDEYDLLDSTGTKVAQAEKHGYCMQDNTTYTPMQGWPGVPSDPVYAESTSCGKGLTSAVSIVHGLSRGWGDTYPTTLPDQAIDITGQPDGDYTVLVHADAVGAVRESDETNNTAQVRIHIAGDLVTVDTASSSGGLP